MLGILQHWHSWLQPGGQLWGRERKILTNRGEAGEPADRVWSQEPRILHSQHPTAHVVLVRLFSSKIATSKQYKAQLISTQPFSGQANFKWERLMPTGNSSWRAASCVPGSGQGMTRGRGEREDPERIRGAEDSQGEAGIWQHAGAPPSGTQGSAHTLVLTVCKLPPTLSFQCQNSSLAETSPGKSRTS